jgi:hypothetical protein
MLCFGTGNGSSHNGCSGIVAEAVVKEEQELEVVVEMTAGVATLYGSLNSIDHKTTKFQRSLHSLTFLGNTALLLFNVKKNQYISRFTMCKCDSCMLSSNKFKDG